MNPRSNRFRSVGSSQPTLRVLSLGAGVQSTTLFVMACRGDIPRFDFALFADTGWEPRAVYAHLERMEELGRRAGIPIRRVGGGNIRRDALDPAHRFASMPLWSLSPDGRRGMARRQCTSEYKIKPIKAAIRQTLGYPHPRRVPDRVFAQMSVGISVDELTRARDSDVRYMRNTFPLLHLGMRRTDCQAYLDANGFGDTPRSACIGCPFHDDGFWHQLKAEHPDEWADACAFDEAIRHGSARATAAGHPLRGTYYLHPTRVPLAQAVLRPGPRRPDAPGCGPFSCPSDIEGGPDAAEIR